MPGRLEQYDDFPRTVKNNQTGDVKPMVKNTDRKEVKKKLDRDNPNLVMMSSKNNGLKVLVFYAKKVKNVFQRVYREVVVPKKRITRWGHNYIEFIDTKSLIRKVFRRDRIITIKLTNDKFKGNQSAIRFG